MSSPKSPNLQISFLPPLPTSPLPLPYPYEDQTLFHIFQYLPRDSIRDTLSLVNSEWSRYAMSNQFWKYLTEIDLKIKLDIWEMLGMNWRKMYFGLVISRWRWRRATSYEDWYDEHFKTIIVGDKKTGKSSVLLRMVKRDIRRKNIKKFVSKFEMSNMCTTMVNMTNKEAVQLQIYDSNIVDMTTYIKACRNIMTLCHAVIIVYSVDKKRTFFNAVNKWLTMVQKRRLPCNVFLVGNKCEVSAKKRMVTVEEAASVARDRNMYHIEVSAANGRNCEDLTMAIGNILYRRLVEQQSYESLWPDIITAQNVNRPLAIRFFHTVVPVQGRPPVNEKDYRDVYTYDSDYSEDESNERYVGYTPLQMIASNREMDEQWMESNEAGGADVVQYVTLNERRALVTVHHRDNDETSTNYVVQDSENGGGDATEDDDDDENYEGSDAEDLPPPPARKHGDDSYGFYDQTTTLGGWGSKGSKSNKKSQSPSSSSSSSWASKHLKYQSPKNRADSNYYDNDSGEDDSSNNNDSDDNVGDEDAPLNSFRAEDEYHPAFKLNSVVREDKGIKTKPVNKFFKATNDEGDDFAESGGTKSELEQQAGLKHLGSGLIDGYLMKTLSEEKKQQSSL